MYSLVALLLALSPPAAAQARAQLNYEVIVAQVDKKASAWSSLGRKLGPVGAEAAEEMRKALAADDTRVMARPLITAYENQEAYFEQRSGDEYVTATISGAENSEGYTLTVEVGMDILSSPATWSGSVDAVDSGMAVLAMRPKKNLVVLVRARTKSGG